MTTFSAFPQFSICLIEVLHVLVPSEQRVQRVVGYWLALWSVGHSQVARCVPIFTLVLSESMGG